MASVRGTVVEVGTNFIEIEDENGDEITIRGHWFVEVVD